MISPFYIAILNATCSLNQGRGVGMQALDTFLILDYQKEIQNRELIPAVNFLKNEGLIENTLTGLVITKKELIFSSD